MTVNNKIERIFNILKSSETEKDWTIQTASSSGVLAKAGQLPDSIDLRADWWCVGDQGKTGSCVGWALADSVMRYHFVKARRLRKKDLLSVRFIWMASKETDEFVEWPSSFIESSGTSLKAALRVARKYGCVRNDDLAFKDRELYGSEESTFYSLAAEFRIRSYFNLAKGDSILNWKTWLFQRGPILTRLDVDSTFHKATKTKGHLERYKSYRYGGHAVAIVGYTPDHFIIRNSWGTDWGDNGFAYATYDYAEKAFTESYGVSL